MLPKTTDLITQNNVVTTPITTSKYEWRTGRWGDCSVTCGSEGGKKIRSVRCINTQSQTESVDIVEDSYCEQTMRPINVARCNEFRCPQWNFGTWGKVIDILNFFCCNFFLLQINIQCSSYLV